MVETAVALRLKFLLVLLCWEQVGESCPSVAFFIIGGTRGGDPKGGSKKFTTGSSPILGRLATES